MPQKSEMIAGIALIKKKKERKTWAVWAATEGI